MKLKNLFERFEQLARDRKEATIEYQKRLIAFQNTGNNNVINNLQQQQQISAAATEVHPRYGRLVPKSEFVEFVREAVKHDCIDSDNPELLVKPILQFMDSVCGRGGTEWVTFDEFVMVLMKVMQT